MNNYGMDPRLDPRYFQRLQMMQGGPPMHHPGMAGHQFGSQMPPPGATAAVAGGGGKSGDENEMARSLLNLKSEGDGGGGGGVASEEEFRMQQQQQQAQQQRQAAMMPGAGGGHNMYAQVGQTYGYPIVSAFDRHMIAAAVNRDNQRGGPGFMDEPQISLSDVSFDDLIGDSTLVVKKDRDLVPDALFVCMAQMKPCKLTQADRVGCYKAREIGFLGMCCKHCGGQPGFGRYFPNSVRSLAQTTTSQTVLKHIGGKCRFCPPTIRKAVLELQRQQAHKEGMASGRPRYGSRKIFFQRMWARLHGKKGGEEAEVDDVPKQVANAESKKDTSVAGAKEDAIDETEETVKNEAPTDDLNPTEV